MNVQARKSISLLEVLIFAAIFSLFLITLVKILLGARFYQREAENRSIAVGVASTKMEEELAQSYSGLVPGTKSGKGIAVGGALYNDFVDWQVNVTQKYEGELPQRIPIPYKQIEVTSSYEDEDSRGRKLGRTLRLLNFIPYPYIHMSGIRYPSRTGETVQPSNTIVPFGGTEPFTWPDLPPLLRIENIKFETPQNILVFYNLSLEIDNFTGLADDDLISSAVFVTDEFGNAVHYNPQANTPIMTQPIINNVVAISGLQPNRTYTVDVRWKKDKDAGSIHLREGNLILFAVETLPPSP